MQRRGGGVGSGGRVGLGTAPEPETPLNSSRVELEDFMATSLESPPSRTAFAFFPKLCPPRSSPIPPTKT